MPCHFLMLGNRRRLKLNFFSKKHLFVLFAGFMTTILLLSGCSHMTDEVSSAFKDANDYFSQGNYDASLGKYMQIIEMEPLAEDRVLFEMGIVHAHPRNEQKDYQKSLECFQKLIKEHPASQYKKDSELMVFNINNVILKDETIAAQQTHIKALRQEVASNGNEIDALQKKIEMLEQELRNKENQNKIKEDDNSRLQQQVLLLQNGTADRILIEKKDRRMTLLSKGKALKTYKIALGGNPIGPKEMQGDNKTPEGIYVIDSRIRDSEYHLSLHISYPNENDRKRARKLGVSPGGDVMIHGIKNGLSWVGDRHTQIDWTKGCIAVTDEEIEEIDKLAPNGTVVEIRP